MGMYIFRTLVTAALIACAAAAFSLPAQAMSASPGGGDGRDAAEAGCVPTPPDTLGPFYKPNAPERSHVGNGYLLGGHVRSWPDCAEMPGARVEFWLAGPDGEYGDEYRATVFADGSGRYSFESHFPPGYFLRPPHVHIRVSAEGYQTLVTQHYPEEGATGASLDLVLVREQR